MAARSPKSKCQQGCFLFESLRRVLPCLFQLWPFLVSLACVCRISIFTFTFTWLLFHLPVLLTRRLTGFRNCPDNPGWSDIEILNVIHKDTLKKEIDHTHRFWGLGQKHIILGVAHSSHYNFSWVLFQECSPNTLYKFLLLFHFHRHDFDMYKNKYLAVLKNKRNHSRWTRYSREPLSNRKQTEHKPQSTQNIEPALWGSILGGRVVPIPGGAEEEHTELLVMLSQ